MKMTDRSDWDILGPYQILSPCVVGVVTEDSGGNPGIGAASHIGDGVLVTARHVVEGRRVVDLLTKRIHSPVSIESIVYPSDENIDLAIVRTNLSLDHYMRNQVFAFGDRRISPPIDHLSIGDHLDDWLSESIILHQVLIFGYPPIPLSSGPELVAARGEINAIIQPYASSPHPLFVVSPVPRGGFSGGPVVIGDSTLLGVVTSSLTTADQAPESGFNAAITVQPIWDLLFEHKIYPGRNAETMYLLAANDEERGENPLPEETKRELDRR